jgi:phospholipid/cholesterol/gamma-HCH transport system ATP-binding protein
VEQGSIIRLENVSKSFSDQRVLKSISLDVEKGESSVIMGGSGSGKTVLLKHIVGLLRPDDGRVIVQGQNLADLDGDELDRLRLSMGYLFQSGALFDSMDVYQNLDFLLDRHTEMSSPERKDKIEEILSWVDLPEKIHQYPAELSGGQKKRIALARAIVLEPDILLYDEPTTGLDPVSVRAVSELVVRLRDERGITSVAITHDLLCAEIIADSIHFLFEGAFLAEGDLESVRKTEHPEIARFFGKHA